MEVTMGKCKRNAHKANINENIAKILTLHRIWNGYTQSQIAKCVEVTFQQIQKYERCINRIPGDHLIDICKQKKWDLSLFSVDNPQDIFDEWINNVDQMTEDSPYPLRIDQINRAWLKIDNVGVINYLSRQKNPRYQHLMRGKRKEINEWNY
jgi:transcriptional regulator with XRE-family HTH domain